MTEPVIGCALVAVFENFVGFVDFLEADFAGGIAWILVRMPFHRELAKRRLETGLIRIAVDFKGFVVAALGGHAELCLPDRGSDRRIAPCGNARSLPPCGGGWGGAFNIKHIYRSSLIVTGRHSPRATLGMATSSTREEVA